MGQNFPIFLVRAAGMLLAGLLLAAVFGGHAHAQDNAKDSYGLKRFPGDNYDTLPAGAGIAAPVSPRFQQAPGTSVGPNGTYAALGAAQNGYQPAYGSQAYATPGYAPAYQPVAQAAPAYGPPAGFEAAPVIPTQTAAPVTPVTAAPYGYKPMPGEAPAPQPQRPELQRTAQAAPAQMVRPAPIEPYGYKALPVEQGGATPAGYQPAAGGPAMPGYILGPGDKVRLTVYGETDLSGEFVIDGSGYARLPLIGQTRAAGYTSQQMEQAVGSALAQGYLKSPRVSVEVSTYRPFYVIGAVQRPGQFPYVEHMNAMNAVAMAGGFAQTAVESVVFIRREGSNQEVQVPVDRSTLIYPGDVIKVHNTLFSDLTNWLSPVSGIATSAATAAVVR